LVRDLDRDVAHGEAGRLLPRPREVLERVAAEPARVDRLERGALLAVRALVEVEDEAPRRARLVVVVARRQRHRKAVERDAADRAVGDHPREHPEALAVRRAPAGHAVDPAAWADRIAVARLEVAAADAPAHCDAVARTASRIPARRRRGP